MTRKEDFFNLYNKYKDDTNFMVIGIEMPDLESHELIVNHKSNFEEKMKYYDSAYDENLIMIRNRDIKIVSFMFAEEVIFAEEEDEDEDEVYFDSIEEVEYNGMLSPSNYSETYKNDDSVVRRDDEHVLKFAELCRLMGLNEEEL
jgi:hypothetical protein